MTTATIPREAPAGPSRSADFDLTPEQRQVRRAVREFAEREILPFVEEHERAERYPAELIRKLIPLGYLTPVLPEAYGGGGSDVVTYGVICEELARVDWVVASVVSVTNSLVAGSIVRFGTEAQRQRWLPAICDGSVLTSACLTEPGGGSDLAAVRTRAVRTAGGWSLSGSKVFISHAAHAGLLLVAATVDPDARHRGVTVFLVDPRADGVEIADLPMRTLKRDNLATIHFERVAVPDDAVLGEVGGGFPILGGALDMGRFSVAARCCGAGAAGHRPDAPLRTGPGGVRAAHRRVPDGAAEDRRHDLPDGVGARPGLPSRPHEGRRRRALLDGGLDGQADGERGGHRQRT